jgi:hypothetical protein
MTTFLLLWNPTKWPWPEFEQGVVADHLSRGLGYDEPWTTGTRTQGIHPGDRVFLLRTAPQPRGIVAAGLASSDIYLAPHWGQAQTLVPHLDIRWTDSANLPYAYVKEAAPSLPNLVVDSGVELEERSAEMLESLWKSYVTAGGPGPSVIFRGCVVTHQSILQVLREYDLLGHREFLRKHRVGTSGTAWLEHSGQHYDAKAVLGIAAGLNPSQFAGGETTTKPLTRLGFAVVDGGAGRPAGEGDLDRPLFRVRDAGAGPSPAVPTPDPDAADRGFRAHRQLENWLADQVRAAGLVPLDPGPADPPFDLAWDEPDTLTVVEVKSLTSANETPQLRSGLAEVLDHAQHLGTPHRVRPVLFVEREPTAPRWASLCRRLGVELWWPGTVEVSRLSGARSPAASPPVR